MLRAVRSRSRIEAWTGKGNAMLFANYSDDAATWIMWCIMIAGVVKCVNHIKGFAKSDAGKKTALTILARLLR